MLRGTDPKKTVIAADGIGRRTMIEVGGSKDPALDKAHTVTEDTPAGAITLTVDTSGIHRYASMDDPCAKWPGAR